MRVTPLPVAKSCKMEEEDMENHSSQTTINKVWLPFRVPVLGIIYDEMVKYNHPLIPFCFRLRGF